MTPLGRWTEADEAVWQAKYEAQQAAAEEAFRLRNYQPPRHSKVNGPPADWKRWCALLDGEPVGHCTEFDVDEGWVQVYVVEPRGKGVVRVVEVPQRRLYGNVEPISTEAFTELRKSMGEIVITADDRRGVSIPGTELRLPEWTEEERIRRKAVAAEIRARRNKGKPQ